MPQDLLFSVHRLKYTGRFPRETMNIVADFLDTVNEHIILHWYDSEDEESVYHISRLELKTRRWSHLTDQFWKVDDPISPFPNRTKDPLPIHDGAAARLCHINGNTVMILFGGRDADSQDTANLYVINLNRLEWFQVCTPPGTIPRADATMEFVDNQLFIFGGNGELAYGSFSVATFDPLKATCDWSTSDHPPLPSLGVCPGSQLIFGNSKIMLFPGVDKDEEESMINFRGHIFIYSIQEDTFEAFEPRHPERLPSTTIIYDTSLYFHDKFFADVKEEEDLQLDDRRCCVLLAAWGDVHIRPRIPRMLALNISSASGTSDVIHINEDMEVKGPLVAQKADIMVIGALTGKRLVVVCTKLHSQMACSVLMEIEL